MKKFFKYFLICLLVVCTFGLVFAMPIVSRLNTNLIVYADGYTSPDTWIQKTWYGLLNPSNFTGSYVWSDGTNFYYSRSSDSSQYVLDLSTSTWSAKTWNGLTSFNGSEIWSDGTNFYRSNGQNQFVLDLSTSTWSAKTWTGVSSSFSASNIWSDGTNYYVSNGAVQYVLDLSTSFVSAKTWNGLTNFTGSYVWSDGTNYYYSNNANQYVLDVSTSTWSAKTWNGLTSFNGSRIWSDGTNFYYSYNAEQYVLDVSTSTWSAKTWNGLTNFTGNRIWYDFDISDTIYFSHDNNNYELVQDGSSSLVISSPVVTQYNGFMQKVDITANSDITLLGLDVYVKNNANDNYSKLLSFDFSSYSVPSSINSNISITEKGILYFDLPFKYIQFDLYDLTDSTNNEASELVMSSYTFNSWVLNRSNPNNTSQVDASILYYNVFPTGSYSILSSFESYVNGFMFFNYFDIVTLYNIDGTVYNTSSFPGIYLYTNVLDSHYIAYAIAGNNSNSSIQINYGFSGYFGVSYDTSLTDTSYKSVLNNYSVAGLIVYDIGTISIGDYFTAMNFTGGIYSDSFIFSLNISSFTISLVNVNNIIWDNVSGADYYQIFYSETENGLYSKIVDNFIGNSYVVSNLGYYYVVACSNTQGVSSVQSTNTLNVVKSTLATPVLSLQYSNLSWSPIANADYYVIYVLDTSTNQYRVFQTNIISTTFVLTITGTYSVKAVSSNTTFFNDSTLPIGVYYEGLWSPTGAQDNSFASLIGAVIDVPVHYVVALFDFDMDFLGINMLNFILSIFTLCIVIFVIRFVLGRRNKD